MSGNVRAADPTLSALDGRKEVLIVGYGVLPKAAEAHLPDVHDDIGNLWGTPFPAGHARWFAVPCRKCFPDALPPGHKPGCCGKPDCWGSLTPKPAPNLSWQLEG